MREITTGRCPSSAPSASLVTCGSQFSLNIVYGDRDDPIEPGVVQSQLYACSSERSSEVRTETLVQEEEVEEGEATPVQTCFRCREPGVANRFSLEGQVLEGKKSGALCIPCGAAVWPPFRTRHSFS